MASTAERASVVIAREAMNGPLTWSDLRAILPGVTDVTISKALAGLMGDGIIERIERMPRVRYGWTGVGLPDCYAEAAEEVDRGERVARHITGPERREIMSQTDRPAEQVAREHGVTVATIRRIWSEHP
jgi:hypothetical protein